MTCAIPSPLGQVPLVPSVFPSVPRRFSSLTEVTFADLTTFRVGGKIAQYREVYSEQEFIAAVCEADDQGLEIVVIGGGSNILASDKDFAGMVVRDMRTGIIGGFEGECAGITITAPAGQPFDQLVATTVANDWCGLESLSGIPGTLGAACVQNIGAYGAELAGVFARARTWDRQTRAVKTLTLADMQFGYRSSILKTSMQDKKWNYTPRYIVLDVTLQLNHASLSLPIAYEQLAAAINVSVGARYPLGEVRRAVLQIREQKGMVILPEDHDTWSAGSFFLNPVMTIAQSQALPPGAPRLPVYDTTKRTYVTEAPVEVPNLVKTSAAWIMSYAGFTKGYRLPGSQAALSSKHVLAITNQGMASAQEVARIAQHIQQQVQERLGVSLHPEPVWVGLW